MIDATAAHRDVAELEPWTLRVVAAVLALAVVGYLGASDPRLVMAIAGILAVVACGVVAYRHPRAATVTSFGLVLVAATKFRLRDATDSLSGVMDWQIALELGLYAVVGVAVVAASAAAQFTRWRVGFAEVVVFAYVAVALASTIWSDAPTLTVVRAVQLAILAGLATVSVQVMPRSRALWTALTLLAGYVLMCAASNAVVTAETTFDPEETHSRFAWFAVHPITAGTLAAIAALTLLTPTFFRRSGTRRIFRIPRYFLLVPLVAILIVTRTRGPLLAFAAAAGALIVLRASMAVRLTLLTLASAGLFVYLISGANLRDWLAAVTGTDWEIVQIFVRGQTADRLLTLNGRLDLWRDLGPVIAASPILGHGFQASRAFVLESAPWAAYAHNALLQSLLDLGAIGTFALVAVIGCGFVAAFRSSVNPWLRALVLSLMVFLALNSITTESFAGSPGFETLLLFMCVLCTAPRRE
jgi:O-antigen ligase